MRLGVVEAGVLSVVLCGEGYARIDVIKYDLSGFSRLGGLIPASIQGVHNSIIRACRSLEDKRLVKLDCRGTHICGVQVDVKGLGAAFLPYVSAAARRELS